MMKINAIMGKSNAITEIVDEQFVSELAEILNRSLNVSINDLKKLIKSAFYGISLNVGVRNVNNLEEYNLKLGNLSMVQEGLKISVDNFKPSHYSKSINDYYFASEEMVRFNSNTKLVGVIGASYFKNANQDEFVEAIVFGQHNVSTLDCVLGIVRAFRSHQNPTYLAPGTIVLLSPEEFKNTKYLQIKGSFGNISISSKDFGTWKICGPCSVNYWDGVDYVIEPLC